MKFTSFRTELVNSGDNLLENFLNALKAEDFNLQEKSIVVISSKVFSYAESRLVPVQDEDEFKEIVQQEAEVYFAGDVVDLTYKQGLFVANSGIDRSNVPAGKVVLWPLNPQKSVDEFRDKLKEKLGLEEIGVVMIDSICLPGRNGVTGLAMAYAGVLGVTDERGKLDLFGNPLRITKVNKVDAVAASANLLMGEAAESVPYCVVEGANIEFTNSKIDSLKELAIPLEDCIFNSVYKYK